MEKARAEARKLKEEVSLIDQGKLSYSENALSILGGITADCFCHLGMLCHAVTSSIHMDSLFYTVNLRHTPYILGRTMYFRQSLTTSRTSGKTTQTS